MKRLKIFFRLKWGEIVEWERKEHCLLIIIGVFTFFVFLYLLSSILKISFEQIMNVMIYIMCGAIWIFIMYLFYGWIKSNWQKAGRIERGEDESIL